MAVLPEGAVLGLLRRALDTLQTLYPHLEAEGALEAGGASLDAYLSLVHDLENQRTNEERLDDEVWGWIWKGKPEYTYIQLYGRCSWIHFQILELL